ncbi:hydrolase 2, exosortase A system-associated [Thiorhodococcus mannitoliphagus]|uniref:Hydrolase 2, exosortase A system-associated n=1 Tax=Thiorhodococcus mannitoliphagus TaxID=329406 RepID=A0A6P1DZT5_9GAMM|nr:hydrolase 2, exosortase A system-associated [Thiorhodococcus mannitoliphagus]NEX22541.1 hydrolase 2, exosortase A system-associated [Thiorhodococcus mannitoliphagus]
MQAGFINGASGRLFYVFHPPSAQPPLGAVLFVPPFAEEMNKARRMVALQARRLAQTGYAVLIPDLYGCGDSPGDFSEATWDGWKADLADCVEWLHARHAEPPLLWGLRAGCLLMSELLSNGSLQATACLFWQPVINGELYLNQFLRLRTASGMLNGQRETQVELRRMLAAGATLEVAGYGLTPALADGLAGARLRAPRGLTTLWIDVNLDGAGDPTPATARMIDDWRAQDIDLRFECVTGEPFWGTQEIVELPSLLDTTDRLIKAISA